MMMTGILKRHVSKMSNRIVFALSCGIFIFVFQSLRSFARRLCRRKPFRRARIQLHAGERTAIVGYVAPFRFSGSRSGFWIRE